MRRHTAFAHVVSLRHGVSTLAQVKVHVQIKERVDSLTLKGLSVDCLPASAVTDKLGQLKAKQKKAAGNIVINPFPYMDVAEFVPAWATV